MDANDTRDREVIDTGALQGMNQLLEGEVRWRAQQLKYIPFWRGKRGSTCSLGPTTESNPRDGYPLAA
jgi:hypothetical protein